MNLGEIVSVRFGQLFGQLIGHIDPTSGGVPVGLEGDVIISGDIAKVSLEFFEHFMVASHLRDWSERVNVGEFGHTRRDHLRDAVQFHRTRALPTSLKLIVNPIENCHQSTLKLFKLTSVTHLFY